MLNSFKIERVRAIEILDSRGNPTLQVEVFTKDSYGRAAVPSGASTGQHEAIELRDGDTARFGGKGVLQAIKNVDEFLAKSIIGMDCREQKQIDESLITLDGTPNKARLGANAILGVSLAVATAAANTARKPLYKTLRQQSRYVLPVPMMNIINGGKHAGNNLAIQEFHIMPIGFTDFLEALRAGVEIYHSLGTVIQNKYGMVGRNVGDEGGFAPPMTQSREAFDAILQAIENAGYAVGKEIAVAIDAAASEFYNEEKYAIDGRKLKASELVDYYSTLCEEYPLVSIEDPFEENDYDHFKALTKAKGKTVQIIGDDIFVSNPRRLQRGIDIGAANALLLKVNQIGTLTEALHSADLAMENHYSVIVSHRSGETEDSFIADLVVALSCGQIKTGAPARSDRTAKYNRLISIAHELGSAARFPGHEFRQCFPKRE
ncbi:MAG: phosphopyruvate hydratase [Promethearchaeota archaeon]